MKINELFEKIEKDDTINESRSDDIVKVSSEIKKIKKLKPLTQEEYKKYLKMKDPKTNKPYAIPLLKLNDPQYNEKYVEYMRMKELDPDGFARILNWS